MGLFCTAALELPALLLLARWGLVLKRGPKRHSSSYRKRPLVHSGMNKKEQDLLVVTCGALYLVCTILFDRDLATLVCYFANPFLSSFFLPGNADMVVGRTTKGMRPVCSFMRHCAIFFATSSKTAAMKCCGSSDVCQ